MHVQNMNLLDICRKIAGAMLPFTESRDAPAEIHVDLGGTITPAQNSKYQKQGTTTTADDDNGGAFDRTLLV